MEITISAAANAATTPRRIVAIDLITNPDKFGGLATRA